MFSRKADAPFAVNVPAPAEDRPSWTRVGVIAAIGFLVGVGWPKLAGVRLGPSVPEVASNATANASPGSAEPTQPTPSASSVAAVAATPLPSAPAPTPPPTVTVSRGTIFACKTADGDALKGGECGSVPGLDNVVMPRLRKLAECSDAATASGKLRLVVKADFARGAISVEPGKNTGFEGADGILACAKTDLAGATPSGLAHENPRYSLAYSVTFGGSTGQTATPAAPSSPALAARTSTTDATQVTWDVAIVRDAPKTGKVVARLQRGTTLQMGPAKDGWYPVKFGDGFASEGWVYRGALGR